jgi:hypothetical protein
MIQPEKLFENFFNDKRFTGLRLSNFSLYSITKFRNANVDNAYDEIIDKLVNAYTPFINGLSNIDTSLSVQKGKTLVLNAIKISFPAYMGEFESEIAHAIGGFGSPNYVAFYPRGLNEYTVATKTQMPLLVERVNTLAGKYAVELGTQRTTELQAFATQWHSALKEQSNTIGDVKDGRADRSTIRPNLEITLLEAIHLVGTQYPGNVAKCMSFFDFGLLTGVSKKVKVEVVKEISEN